MSRQVISLPKLKKIVDTLNQIRMKNFSTPPKYVIPDDDQSLRNLRSGIFFIFLTLWKIHAIISQQGISRAEKINLISRLPDPTGKRFITLRTATRIYNRSELLTKIFKGKSLPDTGSTYRVYQQGGGRGKFHPLMWIFAPLRAMEKTFGHVIEVPLEITSAVLSALGTLMQIISSTVDWLPAPPPLGWVPEVIGDVTEFLHVCMNAFNLFINILRANWPIAIQLAQGMFPQFLIALNGITLQLLSAKRFLRLFGEAIGFAARSSEVIVPIVTPVLRNPIHFMNPINLAKYTSKQVRRIL